MQKQLSNANHQADWLVVGRFGRPQGLKGFVRIISFTDPSCNIMEYTPWYVALHGEYKPLKINAVEAHNKFILVQVEGYLQREQAALLTNCDIVIERHQLPSLPNNEYYWHDLIGMQVLNQDGVLLGKVVEIIATGSNDVLVISGTKRYLVPYLLDSYVLNIDKEKSTIHVNWDVNF